MNRYIKEILWFCLPIVLSVVFTVLLFGVNAFNVESLDINVSDTYYVFSPFHFVIALIILFAFLVYPTRLLYYFFKNNKIANYIFIVFQVIFIIAYSYLMMLNYSAKSSIFLNKSTIAATNSNLWETQYPIGKPFNMVIIQLLLIAFLIYSTVKMDRKFRKL